MTDLLQGKTILIAGAAGLLGSQLVKDCLWQGASVIAADLDIERIQQRLVSLGINANEYPSLELTTLDITNESDVKKFFANIKALDGAANTTYPRNRTYGAHFFEVSQASFNENLSLHLGSSFLFMQQCAAYFKEHQSPFSLVNISSIYGVIAPKFDVYNDTSMSMPVEYAAIKSALIHLTKYSVAYVKNSKFRVNCVSPGGIFDHQPEAFLASYKDNTHGEGMLSVDKVTGSIIFLLSDQSQHVTGQNIVVDDGFSV